MVKIPRVQTDATLTTQGPGLRVDPKLFTGKTEAVQGIADTLNKVAGKFLDAQVLNEKTRANTDMLRRFKELELQAAQTDDIFDVGQFQDKIKKIREDVNGTFTTNRARREFQGDFDRSAIMTDFNVRKTLRKRQMQDSAAKLSEDLVVQKEKFVDIENEKFQQIAIAEMKNSIDKQVVAGMLSVSEGVKLKLSTIKSWWSSKVDHDIEINANDVAAQLKLGEKGIYKDVDASTRITKLATAERMTKKQAEEADVAKQEIQTNNEIALTNRFIEGKLGLEEVQSLFETENISSNYAKALANVITSPDTVKAKTDDDTFDITWDEYLNLDQSDPEAVREFRTKILNTHAAGKLDQKDLNDFFQRSIDPFSVKQEEKKGIWKAVFDFLSPDTVFFGLPAGNRIIIENLMKRRFIDKVKGKELSNEDTFKIGKEVLDNQIRSIHPELADLVDLPVGVHDSVNGFNNVNNVKSNVEVEWVFKDGKLVRKEKKSE